MSKPVIIDIVHRPQHSLLLPHRIMGGISLILMSVGYFCVVLPTTRQSTFPKALFIETNSSASTKDTKGFIRDSLGSSINNDQELSPRGFSLATDSLPPYSVTDLSSIAKAGERLELVGLSKTGTILGTLYPAQTGKDAGAKKPSPGKHLAPHSVVVYWNKGLVTRLPTPKDAYRMVAADINDSGDIVGVALNYRRGKPPYTRVIQYPHTGGYKDLGTLDPEFADPDTEDPSRMRGVSETLVTINNIGTISALVGTNTWIRRSDGHLSAINGSFIFDINDKDSAIGFSGDVWGNASLWQSASSPEQLLQIPLLPSSQSATQQAILRGTAECINNNEDTVISVVLESASGLRRQGRTAYYLSHNGKLRFIAQMRGFQLGRTHINALGDVVGFIDVDPQLQTIMPILYQDNKLYSLSDVAQSSGWRIISAVDINDKRQILGYAIRTDTGNTLPVPVLITPQSLP